MNISLPPDLLKEIEHGVKIGGYATKSEFMRDLVRSWKETKLLNELKKMDKDFAAGKGKELRSLRDLM